jgi:hypothetical protein
MHFFGDARITPGSDIGPHLEDEKRRVAELRSEGFIEQIFRRTDGTGAVLILNDESAESATAQLDSLPFVQLGLMKIPITEIEAL